MTRVYMYWDWVRSEAALINSDGCTLATGLRVECCHEHDISYWFAKDPRSAYARYRSGGIDPWGEAVAIDRATADARFRQCMQQRSTLGRYSPISWLRWLAVRWKGHVPWDGHRQRQAEEQL